MALRTGIVGVGPVGDRIVQIIRERSFPVEGELVIMATWSRPEVLAGEEFQVREVCAELFDGLDVAFFAGREGAKGASVEWGPVATERGVVVVDNGGDFRMHPDYPLVVPEVNMDAVAEALDRGQRHICSPNCSTTQMVVALAPLHRIARIKRVVVATYQSVSGWGGAAQDLLHRQAANWVAGEDIEHDATVFSRPIIADCLPHIDRFLPDGYTKEEMKMVHETRKILGDHTLQISPTTVRVPVDVGHAEAINVEFKDRITVDQAREALADPEQSPGVILLDEPDQSPEAQETRRDKHARTLPTNRDVERDEYKDAVLVGRLRQDETVDSGLNLWAVSDNLRKGAALNVIQIAEQMIDAGLLPR
jgi:aspartate-semialdehyde dehydrogenase